MANAHPYLIIERAGALAGVAHHLHCALASLRVAHYLNQSHALGLDLPAERALLDGIAACARLHKTQEAQA